MIPINWSRNEVKLSILMKRIRKLGLSSYSTRDNFVSPAQMALIDWIAQNSGCGVQEIADGLGLTPPTISISIRKLENCGIIERKPNLTDARAIRFYLTKYGSQIYESQQSNHKIKIQYLLSGLSDDEQDQLIGLLERALDAAAEKILSGKGMELER